MRVLIHEWNNYFLRTIPQLLSHESISYDSFSYIFRQDYYDESFLDWFAKNISCKAYDYVLSVNYWPMLAIACNQAGCRYVAWCYDCPLNITSPEETMAMPTNYIFLFDYAQYLDYKSKGIDTVFHLPLGANSLSVNKLNFDSSIQYQKYTSDISFVGSLYESQLPLITQLLNADSIKLLNEVIQVQEETYNYNIIKECVTDNIIDYFNSQYEQKLADTDNSFFINKKALTFALSCEVTRRNRLTLLNLLGKRYNTNLYSNDTFPLLNGVNQCGPVNYTSEMPYVFHFSKINLNPVLRCIDTGIPLRAFDIMGYGGFLLSSYQSEIDELYINNHDLVMYDSYEDALDKAGYYIKNEDARVKIAQNGHFKTLENYTLTHSFHKILSIIG